MTKIYVHVFSERKRRMYIEAYIKDQVERCHKKLLEEKKEEEKAKALEEKKRQPKKP